MCDKVKMCGFDTLDDLLEEVACLILWKIIILNKVIELSAFCHLHNNEDIGCRVEDLIQFDDIGVADKFEDLDLSFDLCEVYVTFEIMFLFFILDLLMILTATLVPVRSCLASKCLNLYTWLGRTLLSQWSCQECSVQYGLLLCPKSCNYYHLKVFTSIENNKYRFVYKSVFGSVLQKRLPDGLHYLIPIFYVFATIISLWCKYVAEAMLARVLHWNYAEGFAKIILVTFP